MSGKRNIELNRDRWSPSGISEFSNHADESCVVLNRMLEEGLVDNTSYVQIQTSPCLYNYGASRVLVCPAHFGDFVLVNVIAQTRACDS